MSDRAEGGQSGMVGAVPALMRVAVAGPGGAAARSGDDPYAAWLDVHGRAVIGALHDGFAVWLPAAGGELSLVHAEGAAVPQSGEGVAVAVGVGLKAAMRAARAGGGPEWLRGEDPSFSVRVCALPGGAVGASWLRVDVAARGSAGLGGALGRLALELERLMHTVSAVEAATPDDRGALIEGRLGLARTQWRLRGLAQSVPPAPPQRLDRMLSRLQPEVADRVPEHLELRWEVSGPLPEVRLSSGLVGYLLHELVSNAVHALEARPPAEAHAGCVKVSAGLMRLRAPRPWQGAQLAPGSYVYLEVVDDGPGFLGPGALDPFGMRAEGGLGLASVRGLALAVGGGARLRSVVGRGSVVQIALPVATPDERAVRVMLNGEPDAAEQALLLALRGAGVRVSTMGSPDAPNDGLLPVVACARGPGDPRWRAVEQLVSDDMGVPLVLWAPGKGVVRPLEPTTEDHVLEVVRDSEASMAVEAVLRMLREAEPD